DLLEIERRLAMARLPRRARKQLVRDVPDEHVAERVLLVALEGGHLVPGNQLPALELGQGRPEPARIGSHPLQRSAPEDAACYGRVQEHRSLGRRGGGGGWRGERA